MTTTAAPATGEQQQRQEQQHPYNQHCLQWRSWWRCLWKFLLKLLVAPNGITGMGVSIECILPVAVCVSFAHLVGCSDCTSMHPPVEQIVAVPIEVVEEKVVEKAVCKIVEIPVVEMVTPVQCPQHSFVDFEPMIALCMLMCCSCCPGQLGLGSRFQVPSCTATCRSLHTTDCAAGNCKGSGGTRGANCAYDHRNPSGTSG